MISFDVLVLAIATSGAAVLVALRLHDWAMRRRRKMGVSS